MARKKRLAPAWKPSVSASSSFVTNGRGEWLLQKRSENCRDERGRWDFGGGEQKFRENRYAALQREVYEEYGFYPTVTKQLPGYTFFRETAECTWSHWEVSPFIVWVRPEEPIIFQKEKIDEVGWFSYGELLSGAVHPLHSAIPYVLKRYADDFKNAGYIVMHIVDMNQKTLKMRPNFVSRIKENYWDDYKNGICANPYCDEPCILGEKCCGADL